MNGKPRQKVVAYLGRLDELQREGAIDSLVEGLARYAFRTQVLDVAHDLFVHAAKEYGPVLVFKRLWEELGLGELLARYVGARGYGFDVVVAIFAVVLNRLRFFLFQAGGVPLDRGGGGAFFCGARAAPLLPGAGHAVGAQGAA